MKSGIEYKSNWKSRRALGLENPEANLWPPVRILIVRILLLAVMAAVPWYYAAVDWTSQYVLALAMLVVSIAAISAILLGVFSKVEKNLEEESSSVLPPWPSLIFFALAFWGVLQSVPLYDLQGGDSGPNSIRIQRLFLGQSVPSVSEALGIDQKLAGESEAGKNFLPAWADGHRLTWSIEPLHTKAAVGMMAIVGALIWFGRVFFAGRRGQLWLFLSLTLLGVLLALFGIAHVVAFNSTNMLGLSKGSSFGPFVSRNAGGLFLNICLSASFGLTSSAFIFPGQRRDSRYQSMASSRWETLLTKIEMSLGQLTTLQIAAIVANAILIASVFATASRGATISAVVALLAVFAYSAGNGPSVGKLVIAAIVLAIGASFLFSFELDDRIRERLNKSVWDEDFEQGRKLIWSLSYHASWFFASTGSGLGTFHNAYLPFQNQAINVWFYNAESIYWEAMVCAGWVGMFAIVALIGTFLYILWPKRSSDKRGENAKRNSPAKLVALSLLITAGLHSFFDFSLIIPACFVTAAVLLGSIYGDCRGEKSNGSFGGTQRTSSRRRLTDVSRGLDASKSNAKAEPKPSRRSLGRIEQLVLIALTAAIFSLFQLYSISALDSMGRADRMRFWNSRQQKLQSQQRASSPSVILAGIWGENKDRIDTCPDALRILGFSVLNEYQWQRTIDLEKALNLTTKKATDLASPTITHVALLPIAADRKAVEQFFQSDAQMRRWEKSDELLVKALLQSPLDWRVNFGLFMLDYDLKSAEKENFARRLNRIALHRPSFLIRVATIEKSSGRDEEALSLYRNALQGSIGYDNAISQLLKQSYQDGEIPMDLFLDDVPHLLRVASYFPRNEYPISHAEALMRAEKLAIGLPRSDSERSIYLAKIAADRKDFEAVAEHSAEAIRRNPGMWRLRLDLANAALEMGNITAAEEQLTVLLYQASSEAVVQELQKRIEKAKSAASSVTK